MMYVPILKAKRGEFKALRNLNQNLLDTEEVLPLIEVLSMDHLTSLLNMLKSKTWKLKKFFLDLQVNPTEETKKLLDQYSIPVINLNITPIMVSQITEETCIRISNDPEHFKVLRNLKGKELVTLIIDYRDSKEILPISILQKDLPLLKKFLVDKEQQPIWKNTIIASSSFPQSMAHIRYGITIFQRKDFDTIFKTIKSRFPFVEYGDYTVSHPDLIESITPDDGSYQGPPNASAKIKYSTDNGFIIIKGRGLRTKETDTNRKDARNGDIFHKQLPYGFQQYYYLAKILVKSTYYKHENFSWGDSEIMRKSKALDTTGNLESWISICTNHHIMLVLEQLSMMA